MGRPPSLLPAALLGVWSVRRPPPQGSLPSPPELPVWPLSLPKAGHSASPFLPHAPRGPRARPLPSTRLAEEHVSVSATPASFQKLKIGSEGLTRQRPRGFAPCLPPLPCSFRSHHTIQTGWRLSALSCSSWVTTRLRGVGPVQRARPCPLALPAPSEPQFSESATVTQRDPTPLLIHVPFTRGHLT